VIKVARFAFVLIVLVAVVAAAFRVATATDRIKERRDTARGACAASGGEWVKVDNVEACVHAESGSKV